MGFTLLTIATVSIEANSPVLINYYHPQSEPNQLYIATFDDSYTTKTYRMYCPTGMVRDISNGSWKKSRKAYQEDKVKYGSKRIVRKIFDQVCNRQSVSTHRTRPILTNYHHPQSEPNQLYIVSFDYGNISKTYRMYCPTGMVRDISNESWKKSRKAYQEDKVKFGSKRVVRQIFDEVCE